MTSAAAAVERARNAGGKSAVPRAAVRPARRASRTRLFDETSWSTGPRRRGPEIAVEAEDGRTGPAGQPAGRHRLGCGLRHGAERGGGCARGRLLLAAWGRCPTYPRHPATARGMVRAHPLLGRSSAPGPVRARAVLA